MISIVTLILYVLANIYLAMNIDYTLPMILSTVLISLFYIVIIYVDRVLAKNEEEVKHNYEVKFTFKAIVLIIIYISIIMGIFYSHEKLTMIHCVLYILTHHIYDQCMRRYYIIKNESKYNKLIILINKLNMKLNNFENSLLLIVCFVSLYYIINVILF